ncbi:MAG: RHS repeat-associated core domain-containing protein, partial [Pseudomonadota bacterium]
QQADCASTDPSIYPGAAEGCDGLDNDCDGRTDETCSRKVSTYSYDEFNRLLSVADSTGTTSFEYDANGNRTRKQAPGGSTEYIWDKDNRLVELRLPIGIINHMAYDSSGLRVRLEDSSGEHNMLLDGIEEIAEYTALGARSSYVHDPGVTDGLLAMASDFGGQYFHQDALGSIVGVSDGGGLSTRRARYDVFGTQAEAEGDQSVPWRFSGRRWDPDSTGEGLGYFRARYYDASVGLFLSRDPVARFDVSQWSYALQSPVNAVDPTGEVPTFWGVAALVSVLMALFAGCGEKEINDPDFYAKATAREMIEFLGFLIFPPLNLGKKVEARRDFARDPRITGIGGGMHQNLTKFTSPVFTHAIWIDVEAWDRCARNHDCDLMEDTIVREWPHVVLDELHIKYGGKKYYDTDREVQDMSEFLEMMVFGGISCERDRTHGGHGTTGTIDQAYCLNLPPPPPPRPAE